MVYAMKLFTLICLNWRKIILNECIINIKYIRNQRMRVLMLEYASGVRANANLFYIMWQCKYVVALFEDSSGNVCFENSHPHR